MEIKNGTVQMTAAIFQIAYSQRNIQLFAESVMQPEIPQAEFTIDEIAITIHFV